MGYRVLVSEDEVPHWDWHPYAVRWQVVEGELILFHQGNHVITKYECTEWIKVEETK